MKKRFLNCELCCLETYSMSKISNCLHLCAGEGSSWAVTVVRGQREPKAQWLLQRLSS